MAQVTSNLTSVAAALRELGQVFHLGRSGAGGRPLGDEMADVIAAGVQARTLEQQQSPSGGTLAANRGGYGRRKRARGVPVGVGLVGNDVGGEMLEFEQVRGQVAIGPNDLVMTAGLDADAKEKVEWFSEGNPANNQPPRPFYELDAAIEGQIDDLLDQTADRRIRALGG